MVFHGRNLQLLRHQRRGGAESQRQAVAVGRGHAQPGDGADLPGGEVAIFDETWRKMVGFTIVAGKIMIEHRLIGEIGDSNKKSWVRSCFFPGRFGDCFFWIPVCLIFAAFGNYNRAVCMAFARFRSQKNLPHYARFSPCWS